MIKLSRILLISTLLVTTGCAMKYPQNADEFRREIPESMFGNVETFEVNQPTSGIAAVFQSQAETCLNKTIRKETCSSTGGCTVTVTHYKPTVRASARSVELHVQQDINYAFTLAPIPEGGIYSLVVDVTPLGRNNSRVTMYRGPLGNDTVAKAVRAWVSGRGSGCPDLTQG